MVLFVILFFVLIPSHRLKASTDVPDEISVDTVWTPDDSPYVVSSEVIVDAGATLTIQPGAIVKFDGGNISFLGQLDAQGTTLNPIYFTSLYDDTIGGDTDGDGGESGPTPYDGGRLEFMSEATSIISHANISYLGDGISILNSSLSMSDLTYSSSSVITSRSSNLSIKNAIVNDLSAGFIESFDNSNTTLDSITLNSTEDDAVMAYGSSNLAITNSSFSNVFGSVLLVYQSSMANLNNVSIQDTFSRSEGVVSVYGGGTMAISNSSITNSLASSALCAFNGWGVDSTTTLKLTDVTLDGGTDTGLMAYAGAVVSADNLTVKNFSNNGIEMYQDVNANISNSSITDNQYGATVYQTQNFTISTSTIKNNTGYGLYSYQNALDARNNWWGSADGPYVETWSGDTKNASSTGEKILDTSGDTVQYSPWLSADPKEKAKCCSNILFIPGIEASRLYTQGTFFENQLWEPNRNADVEKLYLNDSGESINTDVYTKDVISRSNLPCCNIDVYRTFFDELNGLVKNNTIKQWEAYPYDWRKDLNEVVVGGSLVKNNDNFDILNLENEINKLAETSQTGKVTIVAHSNGGLVTKYLFNRLENLKKEGKSSTVDKIDKVIFAAVPQDGTPEAVASLLSGYGQGIGALGINFILNESVARELARNMPAAYNLLPSKDYFNRTTSPVVVFDPSVDQLNKFRQHGNQIDSFTELQNFLLGYKDKRNNPLVSDTTQPIIANSLLLKNASSTHYFLDNVTFPTSTKVYQIVGSGRDTVSGIKYKAIGCAHFETACVGNLMLDEEPVFTSDGDGVVVTTSAASMNYPTYYIDLRTMNQDQNINIDHKNFLESVNVQELIKNLIQESNVQVAYVSSTTPVLHTPSFRLSVHSPVSVDVDSDAGKHTGLMSFLSDQTDLRFVEDEIPNSYYLEFGEGKYVGLTDTGSTTIKLDATGVGTFTLNIDDISGTTTKSVSFVDIPVTPTTEVSVVASSSVENTKLLLDVDGDGKNDMTIKPQNDFDALSYLEIIKNFVLTLDIKQNQKNQVINKITEVTKLIKNGKIKKAEKLISNYMKSVSKRKKHVKKISQTDAQELITLFSNLLDNLSNN